MLVCEATPSPESLSWPKVIVALIGKVVILETSEHINGYIFCSRTTKDDAAGDLPTVVEDSPVEGIHSSHVLPISKTYDWGWKCTP